MCELTRGIKIGCKDANGGLVAAYFVNWDEWSDSGFLVTSNDITGHQLTSLGTLATASVFKYELKNSANTFNQDTTSSRDNGSIINTQTLSLTLPTTSAQAEYQLNTLISGRPVVFIEALNGQMLALGVGQGMEISGTTQIQGTIDSLNGYTISAIGTEINKAYHLDDATIVSLKSLVSPNYI